MGEILFVDDEEVILLVAEGVFADAGIDIITTQDPLEALQIIKSREISVIVTDNRMPTMLGIDLLSQVMHISPDTVKILMTGYADLQTALDAIEKVGAFRVIVKPWENEQLVEVIKLAVNRYELKSKLRQGDLSCIQTVYKAIQLTNSPILPQEEGKTLYNALIYSALGNPDKLDAAAMEKARSLLSEKAQKLISESQAGNVIPFHERIIAIAEIFDVLTTHTHDWSSGVNTNDLVDTLSAMKDEVQDSDMADLLIFMIKSADHP